MRRRQQDTAGDLIGGTLDMLVLRTLRTGPMHGFGIALDIEARSGDKLLVEQGSLYPALYRLEKRRWIASDWGRSDTNRRARYYRLTAAGRRQLTAEASRWTALVDAVARVMRPAADPAAGESNVMRWRRLFGRSPSTAIAPMSSVRISIWPPSTTSRRVCRRPRRPGARASGSATSTSSGRSCTT